MKFLIDRNSLVIELQGFEPVWALKARLIVQKSDIVSVEYREEFKDWRKWELRLPGTGIPGVLVAGSFLTEDGWDFLYLRDPRNFYKSVIRNVLHIETVLTKYRRIIITCEKSEVEHVLEWAR